jgi:TPR repeat protein
MIDRKRLSARIPRLISALLLTLPAALAIAQEPQAAVEQPASVAAERSVADLRRILLNSDDAAEFGPALEELSLLAQSTAEAAYALGGVYVNGSSAVPRDYAAAEPLLKFAAANGEPLAFVRLGDIYRTGEGYDRTVAPTYYRKAAEAGHAGSAYRMADYYRTGTGGLARDRQQALRFYQLAEQGGETRALLRLGDLHNTYHAELGLEQARAVEYYEDAVAVGDNVGLVRLANLYRTGIEGVPADAQASISYYQSAIDAGNVGAIVTLAEGYLDGSLGGEPGIGVQLLQTATSDGVSGAAVALARAYLGSGTLLPDPERAVSILSDAAQAGDTEAGRLLIRLYVGGLSGVGRNLSAARDTLDNISAGLEPAALAFESLVITIAGRPAPASYPDLLADFGQLSQQGKRNLLARIYGLNTNAYVFLIQHRLSELGFYSGEMSGMLTSTTIAAFNRACAAFAIETQCLNGPLSFSARRASQESLFPS